MIKKLLIANRGEIAVRIIRTAHRMGIQTVAVYSEIDKSSLHHSLADEAFCIGQANLAETYLNGNLMIQIALNTHCDAIHPGYGFLSENPVFVKACEEAGIAFIGPKAEVMHIMGNKVEARNYVSSLNIPVTKGISGSASEIVDHVDQIGFPILVKAAGGGGGKGMRIVNDKQSLPDALEAASREAKNYFADGTVYIEKYLEEPRHIEFQILGDQFGNVIHLFERECSIQRRYQKIIEEAPSPTLTPELRDSMGKAAVAIGKATGYASAGTIEFLVDKDLQFYFLEMNTRIQVEHPVTELTTGIDIVEEQIRIASYQPLRYRQNEIEQKGHSIECRIYAENPAENFLPSPGKLSLYHKPSGKNVRVDDAMSEPFEVSSFFDPMIAKLITHGHTREEARIHMINALDNYGIHGIECNVSFLKEILQDIHFIENRISTKYCQQHTQTLNGQINEKADLIDKNIPLALSLLLGSHCVPSQYNPQNIWSTIGYWRVLMQPELELEQKTYKTEIESLTTNSLKGKINDSPIHLQVDTENYNKKIDFHLNDKTHACFISIPEPGKIIISYETHTFEVSRKDTLPAPTEINPYSNSLGTDGGDIKSPMPGKVIKVNVREGEQVKKGDVLLVVEAMKMENNILSPADAKVDKIIAETGSLVNTNTILLHLSESK